MTSLKACTATLSASVTLPMRHTEECVSPYSAALTLFGRARSAPCRAPAGARSARQLPRSPSSPSCPPPSSRAYRLTAASAGAQRCRLRTMSPRRITRESDLSSQVRGGRTCAPQVRPTLISSSSYAMLGVPTDMRPSGSTSGSRWPARSMAGTSPSAPDTHLTGRLNIPLPSQPRWLTRDQRRLVRRGAGGPVQDAAGVALVGAHQADRGKTRQARHTGVVVSGKLRVKPCRRDRAGPGPR